MTKTISMICFSFWEYQFLLTSPVSFMRCGCMSPFHDMHHITWQRCNVLFWNASVWKPLVSYLYVHGLTLYLLSDSFLLTLWGRDKMKHFADDIFKRIFFKENIWISIKIWLKSIPRGQINNISALVQTMAWRRLGDKPLFKLMMVSLHMRHSASVS